MLSALWILLVFLCIFHVNLNIGIIIIEDDLSSTCQNWTSLLYACYNVSWMKDWMNEWQRWWWILPSTAHRSWSIHLFKDCSAFFIQLNILLGGWCITLIYKGNFAKINRLLNKLFETSLNMKYALRVQSNFVGKITYITCSYMYFFIISLVWTWFNDFGLEVFHSFDCCWMKQIEIKI